DIPDDPGYMPRMAVGAPQPDEPNDAKQLPRFPILLQDDVPLLVVYGYNLGGLAERAENHVAYFRKKGRVRAKPLRPSDAPLSLLHACARKTAGLYNPSAARIVNQLMASQLLDVIDTVYRPDTGAGSSRLDLTHGGDEWKAVKAKVAKLDIRWNTDKNRYTFK